MRNGKKVISPVKRRNSRVPPYVVVLGCLEFSVVFLFNIRGLEQKLVVLIRATWGWGGADGGPKIASLCPISGNIGRFWEVNAVERRIKIVKYGDSLFCRQLRGKPMFG